MAAAATNSWLTFSYVPMVVVKWQQATFKVQPANQPGSQPTYYIVSREIWQNLLDK